MINKIKWEISEREIEELEFADYNPRKMSKIQKNQLERSLTKFGIAEPIIINANNKVIGGHQRLNILKKNGQKTIKVSVPNRELTIEEEKELNLRLNKNLGDWDFEALVNNFDVNLLEDVGFLASDLSIDFAGNDDKNGDGYDQGETSETKYNVSLGDIYQLGDHKIICGDCTDPDIYKALLVDTPVNMLLTDPPYGVDYSNKNDYLNSWDNGTRNQKEIKNDNIEDYRKFFDAFLSLIRFSEYNTFYIFMSAQELHNLRLALDDCGLKWAAYLVWLKNNHVLGHKDYNAKYEFCCYGWSGKHKFFGKFSTNILEFDKPLVNDLHPTMKPVNLLKKLITDGSQLNDVIYDPFLGSGSTLIACEEKNRRCYGIELEPAYVSISIERWEKLTNKQAVKA